MSWLRIDDGFAEHPKMLAITERARWMHVTALCYSARNLTDGLLDGRAVKVVAAIVDKPCKQAVKDLVAAGVWLELDDGTFQIKDYLEWNPDAATVKKLRKERAEAGKLGGLAKRKANAKASDEANAVADVRTPSLPGPSHESSKALGRLKIDEGQMRKLMIATGARDRESVDKLTRTILAHRCGEREVARAIEEATGPGVNDPLAVALSSFVKNSKKEAA